MSRFFACALAVAVAAAVCGCSSPAVPSSSPAPSAPAEQSSARTSATADTVFGFPEQIEARSGSGEPIGTVAVFRAASSDCTHENIELWCNQYVRWGLDNWAVVEYSDKPGSGVYASGAIVEVNVSLAPDYSLADDSGATLYVFSANDVASDGRLSEDGDAL